MKELALDGPVEQVARTRVKVKKILSDFAPDLIHLNGLGGSLLMYLLCRNPDLPSLLTLHGSWGTWRPAAIAQIFGNVDWIAACSEDTLRLVRQFDSSLVDCSSLVRNALPLPIEAPETESREDFLLCAGRLAPEKGFELAIQSLSYLPERMRLKIAGYGPQMESLRSLVVSLKVQDRVDFLGALERPQLASLMRRARLVLCPSWTEGFGLVALEAAHSGTPVVASQVGGLPEVVVHNETGVLLNHRDPKCWALEIVSRLESGELESMGQRAKQRATLEFSWKAFVDSYLDIYHRVARRQLGDQSQRWRCANDPHHRRRVFQMGYFHRAQERTRKALSEPGSRFQVAGGVMHIRTREKALLEAWSTLWPAAAPDSPVDLTVELDCCEQPVHSMPACEGLSGRWRAMGAASLTQDPVLVYARPGLACYYERRSAQLAGAVSPLSRLLPSERGKPLLLPLLTWLADRNLRVYHASAVAWMGRGVLLVGGENSGKTTVQLACLRAGWDFVADDLVVVRQGQIEPIYNSLWLARKHAARHFPELLPQLSVHPLDPKGFLRVRDIPAPTRGRVTIEAAIWTQFDDSMAPARLLPASQGDLLKALIPSSFSLVPGIQDGEKLHRIARLLRNASVWRLSLGHDLSAVPHLVGQALGP